MGVALPVLAIASTGLSAAGKVMEGNARSDAAMYRSQVAANNAKIAAQNATWTMQSGEIASGQAGMKAAAVVGRQKAAQAANNIDVNSGSAVDVRSATAALGMLDALTIRSDAARKAYGYQVQEQNFQTESVMAKKEAKNAKVAGWLGAAQTMLSSASTVGGQFSGMQGGGSFGAGVSSVPGIGPPLNLVPTFNKDDDFFSTGAFA